MPGLKGITMNTAPEAEPHIYAEDDAAIYQAICGPDGVFEIGQQCESQVISNNKVRVKDGVIIIGGHFARIPYGDYIDFEIANGQAGKKRNDILIAKFTTTGSGGIDTFTGVVKQGAAVTGTATDPALTQNDLYQNGQIRELPLYRVKLDGLSITEVEPMFNLIPTIPTLNASLSELSETESAELRNNFNTLFGYAERRGKMVSIASVFAANQWTYQTANWITIGTLPETMRPSRQQNGVAIYGNNQDSVTGLRVLTTGEVQVYFPVGTNRYLSFSISFLIE